MYIPMKKLDKSQIERAKAADLITLASQYAKLHKEGTGEMAGPCPKCGGTDRFHVRAGGFFCRQCKPMDKNKGAWYDSIEFIQWMDGCSFPQAVEKLTGPLNYEEVVPVKPVVETKPVSHAWQAEAGEAVGKAQEALMNSDETDPGAAYLLGRGLEPHTWMAFGLGYSESVSVPGTEGKAKAPAIVIPWYAGGQLAAVRNRFVQPQSGHRITAMHGSSFSGRLYGGQALGGDKFGTLVLCEGEMNAMSVWQVARPWGWDVLSLGSESSKLGEKAIQYAGKYSKVIIWMDRKAIVKQLMHLIPGSYGTNSPVYGESKLDPNVMLQDGSLGSYLVMVRTNACETNTEVEEMRAGVREMGQVWGAVDEQTLQALDSQYVLRRA